MLIDISSRIVRTFSLVLALATLVCQIHAQSSQSSLRGKVVDPAGAPIAGATVTAAPAGSNPNASTTSDQDGEFSLHIEPGNYAVTVVSEGFDKAWQNVTITTSDLAPITVMLQIAQLHNAITVIGTDYRTLTTNSATKTLTPLLNVPQSITVVTGEQIKDQLLSSIGDIVRYVPGVTAHQGENNRDQIVIRGVSSSADFFLNGVRDDVQYYRDLYNVDRIEVLRGPNAMIFGRGGGGGVINRVTKEASFAPFREIMLQGGSYKNKRIAVDIDQPFTDKAALRLNSVYENFGSFRDFVSLERYGINPTLTLALGRQTTVRLGYERFRDYRIADRGIPSFHGRPAEIDISTYFGNPNDSYVRALVNLGSAVIEHQTGGLNLRNSTLIGAYDRGYQNYVPGSISADQTTVIVSAYNNSTQRLNIFNQTDLTYGIRTGRIRHTLLAGLEVGRQLTDNFRNTGFFNNTAISTKAPYSNPTINTPVTFRQSATDADNHLRTNIGAAYAQDQIDFSRYFQAILGLRFDNFDLKYHNNRNGEDLRRIDNLVSPRVGLIFKPIAPLSIYGNYAVSYLPSSGDQFSSLTAITQQVKPEKFNNYELGVKWDIRPSLALTAALYRLERKNTRATDPSNPTRIVQTGSQRTNGYEIGLNGVLTRSWRVSGSYAYQDAFITSATTAARAGAQVAQVPHHNFSLWNNCQIFSRLAAGLGVIHRTDMFAAVDNTVKLPGYTRADAAMYFALTEKLRLQANVENLFDEKYHANADGNNNISPGSSRAVRLALSVRF